MPTFTVKSAQHRRAVTNQHGDFQVIGLTLVNGDGEPKGVEWFTKATTPIPEEGATLEGTIENGQYGPVFKKAKPAFNGGGGRGRDPKESAQIVQQHSQEMALLYARLQFDRGALPDNFNLEQLLVIAAKFAADAKEAQP